MSTKKRFFKKEKKMLHPILKHVGKQGQKAIGNKSENVREKTLQKPIVTQEAARKQKSVEFPKNPQTITEKLVPHRSVSFWIATSGIILVGLVSLIGCVAMVMASFQMSKVIMSRIALQRQMKLWEDISKKYPTYRDANFQVAVLAYRLGDKTKEQEFLDKTLIIDPNFEPAKRLGE